ncbi:hypothetical protein FRC09_005454 [Ceratobasidium sp. 395]|nr:hypothetical protein FRC09_005454 [Ceratobasidium sp. 395]
MLTLTLVPTATIAMPEKATGAVAARTAAPASGAKVVTTPSVSPAQAAPPPALASRTVSASPVSVSTVAKPQAGPAILALLVGPAAKVPLCVPNAQPTRTRPAVALARLARLAMCPTLASLARPVPTPKLVPLPARLAPAAPSPTPTAPPAARTALPEHPLPPAPRLALLSTARPESTPATALARTARVVPTAVPTPLSALLARPTLTLPVAPALAAHAPATPRRCLVLLSAPARAAPASTSPAAVARPAPPVGTLKPVPLSAPTAPRTLTPAPAPALALSALPARDADCIDKCPDGKIYTGGYCQNCPAGKYSNNNMCSDCPAGTISNPGSKSCTVCPGGSVPSSNGQTCTTCPRNTYSNGDNCSPCPAGSTSNPGSSSCGPQPSRRAQPILSMQCPSGEQLCPVLYGRGGEECLNTMTNSESCGGCVGADDDDASKFTGRDCSTIEGAGRVQCNSGKCVMLSCAPHYELSGGECVKNAGASKNATSKHAKRAMHSRHDTF